jgi:hypothetical protein
MYAMLFLLSQSVHASGHDPVRKQQRRRIMQIGKNLAVSEIHHILNSYMRFYIDEGSETWKNRACGNRSRQRQHVHRK